MRSILLVTLSNLRKRKKQNLLTGLSIFLSVILLTTSLGILGGIHKPFDTMFDRLKASHILLLYDTRENNTQKITDWFEKQPEVEHVSAPRSYFLVTEPLTYRNEKVRIMVYVTELNAKNQGYDNVLKTDGNDSEMPGWGEAWIPKPMSVRYGITAGDTIMLPLAKGLYPLKVSGIVVDPHYVSGMINPNRIWVAPGMLTSMVKISELNHVVLGVRLKDKAETDIIWTRFRKEMEYNGENLQYSLFKSVFTSIYKIIGIVIIIFSVLSIIIACYIISSAISSSVLADSRLAGTLRALGFRSGQVTATYMLQYAIISSIALPAGLLAGYYTIRIILRSVSSSIGLTNLEFPFSSVFAGSAVFFILLIGILVIKTSLEAGKIQPAHALRSMPGDTNLLRKNRRSPLRMDSYVLSVWLASKMIFDNPKKSLLSIMSMVFTVFIIVFSVNTANSFNKMNNYKSLWGFDNSDLQIFRSDAVILPIPHEKFMKLLAEEKDIRDIVPFSYYNVSIPQSGDQPPEELSGKVYDRSPSLTGLTNIEGRHPVGKNEISLCVGTARRLNKRTGDSITVFIENTWKKFIVTGIYQDISNMGKGFRLTTEAVKAINPLFEPDRYSLILADHSRSEEVKSELLKRFGEIIKIELTIEDQLSFMNITNTIYASMLLISIFFTGILIVSVFNDIYLGIRDNRKTMGIFGLVGFTPAQLRIIMIIKTIILTLSGIIIGLPLALTLEPLLISSITSGFGVVKFPLVVTLTGTIWSLAILLILTTLVSRLASSQVNNINTRTLINE